MIDITEVKDKIQAIKDLREWASERYGFDPGLNVTKDFLDDIQASQKYHKIAIERSSKREEIRSVLQDAPIDLLESVLKEVQLYDALLDRSPF